MKRILMALSLLLSSCLVNAAVIQLGDFDGGTLGAQYGSVGADPKYAPVLNKLRQNKFSDARTAASQAVRLYPSEYHAHLLMVLTYVATEDFAAVDRHLAEVAHQVPAFEKPLRENLFTSYKGASRYFRALEVISDIKYESMTSELLGSIGEIYLAQGKFKNARTALSAALEKAPNQEDLRLELARTQVILRDFQSAKVTFRSISNSTDLKVAQLAAANALALNDLSEAGKYYEQILKNDAGDFLANLNRGVIALAKGNAQKAIPYFEQCLKTDRYSADAWVARYIAQRRSNQKPDSLKRAPNAVALDPLFAMTRIASGLGFTLEHVQTASNILPDLIYSARGTDKLDANLLGKAPLDLVWANLLYRLGYYQTLASLAEQKTLAASPWLDIVLARTDTKLGDSGSARERYETLMQQEKELLSPYVELAELDVADENYTSAIERYQHLLTKDGKRIDWLFQLSSLYNLADQGQNAIDSLMKARQLTNNPMIENQIAATYSEIIGDQKKAISVANEAIKKYPEQTILLDTVAWAYHLQGNYQKAADFYERMLKATGANHTPLTFYRIGLTYEKLGTKDPSRLYELSLNAGSEFEGSEHARKALLGSR